MKDCQFGVSPVNYSDSDSLSSYLFVRLPVLSNLHFGIDFGRNYPGSKRPRAESTHLPRPKRPTPKLGRNDPGRNDPGRNNPGPKQKGFRVSHCLCGGPGFESRPGHVLFLSCDNLYNNNNNNYNNNNNNNNNNNLNVLK